MFKKVLLFVALASCTCGCATQQGAIAERDKVAIDGRLEELEATQTRLRTRVVTLEKEVAQLEERLSLMSRRTSLDPREVVRIEPTTPASSSVGFRTIETVSPSSNVEYVEPSLDDDVYQEIVISDEKKRAYFGSNSPKTTSTGSTNSSGTRKAYDNVVTDEKLPSLNGASTQSVAPTAAPNTSTATAASPMTYYQEGIDLYRRGMYEDGRARFEQFLATKPETEYIDNALYWIGECYYGQGKFNEAANYFHKIVQEYPKTNKVPDALLKVSLTYQQLGRIDSAREMLRYLMDAFPGTEAARIGKEKYEALNASK